MNLRPLLLLGLFAVSLGFVRAEQVVFSEVMYQPPAGKPEFIEISNITGTPIDIARWKFLDGLDYTFPDFDGSSQAHILQPFERIVLSSTTAAATRTAYPSIPANVRVFGPWQAGDALSNNGEKLTLMDKNGVIACTLEYSDHGRWPIQADGAGHSIVLANENKTIDDWRVWRASTANGGSPGVADPAVPATGITLNEVHFGATGKVDWIEVRNDSRTTSNSASGLFLASKNDFSDKVALSGVLTPGSVSSINVDFAANGDGEIKIYLLTASNNVQSAVLITRKVGRDDWQKFPAGGTEWYNDTTDTRDAANNPTRNTDIVINEIMADAPSNQRDGEFIELYNRGAQPVNVGGWKLKEGVNFTFPANTMIQPGGYVVVGANAAYLNTSYAGLNALGNWDGQLSNSGEMIKLDDANGNLVNSVDYRFGGEWPELAAGNGSSLELINPNTDNSVGSAWKDSDESQKSSFQSFSINGGTYLRSTATGAPLPIDDELRIWAVGDTHIILKNIVLRPTAGGSNILVNAGVTTLNDNNVDGWQSRGSHALTHDDAEGIHLVADGGGDNKVNHMEKDAAGLVANTGYTLEFEARWVWGKPRVVTQTWDTSWGGTALLSIPANLGTPGAANSGANANPAVQLSSLAHSPAVPTSTQTVTVTAKVSSLTPVQSVSVVHRLDNINANGSWNTTAMVDNGTGGDAVGNDGVYTAQIVPATFGYGSSSAVVEFYVQATASNGAITDLPRKGAAMPGLWAVGTPGSSDMRRLRVVMSAYWLDSMDQGSLTGGHTSKFNYKYPLHSSRYLPCTFIQNDTDIFYGAGCHKTGSPFTRQTDSNLTRGRVTLPTDNLLRGKTRIYWDNDSGTSMLHNRIVRYWLYLLGVPANENEFCRVARNGAGYTVRETNEVFDKDMLDRIWENGSNGYFYEMDDKFWIADDGRTRLGNQDGSWTYKSTDSQGAENPTAYHNQFVPKSREVDYDFSGFIEWTKQLTNNGATLTQEQLERMADTQAMTAYAAVRGYVGDWDTMTGRRGKNGYMYQRSTDHKWTFLHWDSDLGFQTPTETVLGTLTNIPTYYNRPFIKRYLNYYLTEMLNTYNANGPRLTAWLTAEENASSGYTANAGTYTAWSTNRATTVQNYIGGTYSLAFAATLPASGGTTTSNAITITGTAPSSAFRVECASQPGTTFAWSNETTWSLSNVVLATGVNNLTFRMLDFYGNQVGTTLPYTITKTNDAPPVVVLTNNPSSQNVGVGEILSLDASDSYDPDAGALTYTWTVTPSTNVSVSTPSTSKRNLIFSTPGTYTVSVQATDPSNQSTTVTRTFSVFSAQDFDSFTGDYMNGYTFSNVELKDNYSPETWYSLNETDGQLVINIEDTVPRPVAYPLTFPTVTKPLPGTSDFLLQTDLSMEVRQFGSFFTGLWLETTENGLPTRYAFGLENGTAIKVNRSFNGSTFTTLLSSVTYTGGPISLRIIRQNNQLLFQRIVNGVWTTISTRSIAAANPANSGGVFVGAGSTSPLLPQTVRVGFDYLLIGNPGHASDLVKNLRLTEIMYNPPSGSVEYLEMQNIGQTPLDLTGAYFEASLPWNDRFTFPNLTLQPGQTCVVTNNSAGFEARYGTDIVIAGQATGGLANDTEQIVLKDPSGNTIFDVTYFDSWYSSTDGNGRSLDVAVSDPTRYNQASAWRPSYVNGGSAGYIDVAPAISGQPSGATVNPGQPFNLQASATGTPAPSYQWRKGGQNIPNANSATYSVLISTEDDQGSYEVVATNAAGSATSDSVTVTINDPVSITADPTPKAANPGTMVTFNVGVGGTGPFTYLWKKGTDPIPSATDDHLTIQASEANEGSYSVTVSNAFSSATSNPATLTSNDPVQITTHPADKTVNPDTEVTFSVVATGTGPFSYVWRKDGEPIPDEVGSELTFTVTEDDEAVYDVVVSNAVAPVTSNGATLSVNDPIEITQHPTGGTLNPSGTINLSVSATGTAPITYQWWKGTHPIDNAIQSTLSIPAAGNAGDYKVVVTNVVGSVTSNTATIFVNTPISIVTQPAPQVVQVGGKATFSVEVSGTGPFSYQWQKGTDPIDLATNSTFTIPVVSATDASDYNVIITNPVGSVQSNNASLSFLDWTKAVGIYQGLLKGPDITVPLGYRGRVTITLAKTGKYTGKLELLGLKYSFKGQFNVNLEATSTIARKNTSPISLALNLNGVNSAIEIKEAHAVIPPAFDSSGTLPQIPKRTKLTPAPLAGRFTMIVEPGSGAPNDLTAPGFATITVNKSGSTTWAGKLPDGANFKGTAWLTTNDHLAIYTPLYVAKAPYAGHIAGALELNLATADGSVSWNKPLQTKGYWFGGLSCVANLNGRRYTPPVSGFRAFPTLENGLLDLDNPPTGTALQALGTLSIKNVFAFPATLDKMKLSFSKTTGLVSGSFLDRFSLIGGNPQLLPKPISRKLQGVILQGEDRATGFFQSTNSVGTWELNKQ